MLEMELPEGPDHCPNKDLVSDVIPIKVRKTMWQVLKRLTGEQVELALWGHAGQEAQDHLRPSPIMMLDVMLMCFSH